MAALTALATDPLASALDLQRLKHHLFGWRLRVRAYRVLYDLDPLTRTIDVGRIERRSSTTYRR
jgi:mRNA-degrading endonuclease RelE of RelBE toxin-antitoxin system